MLPRHALPNSALVLLGLLSSLGLCASLVMALSWPSSAARASVALATASPSMTTRSVALIVDGTSQTLQTAYSYPVDVLRQVDMRLGQADRVWLDGQPASLAQVALWPLPVREIVIQRAVTVTIDDEGQIIQHTTSASQVAEALFEAGIVLYISDQVTPSLDASVSDGLLIRIQRASPVIIHADGETLQARAQAVNVGAALAEIGLRLDGLDYVLPPEDTPLSPGMTIRVVRVTEALESFERPIPYSTRTQPDPELPLDQRRTLQSGRVGLLRLTERVRYADGVEMSREPLREEVVRVAQDEIIGYGTKIVLYNLQTPEGTLQYWRKLRVYASSYHPAALGGDDVTAIGEKLRKGIIGADPRIIPYRTRVYVFGYGQGMIADTGGPRSSPYWIDLGYSDADFVGWHRYVDVYLLAPVPPNVPLLLPDWRPMRGVPDRGRGG
ncbi:MAG: G5 domain-containing protein [Anaerolineae bacterium]|nr:G5 domain-containing protein [Anaerolineae bacterium]MDW8173890.1 G5 domain-containing protein [Anaerolineae bacterium]